MTPGPDEIIACPHCGELARRPTLNSGNTFGAVLWSDGKLEAPMMPELPVLTRCRGCRALFWIRDAEVVGELDLLGFGSQDVPEAWQAAKRVDEPDLDDYAEALESGVAKDRDEELFLRTRYWWLFNDPQRTWRARRRKSRRSRKAGAQGSPESTPAHTRRMEANLEQLAELLDVEDPAERLMRAEIARQTGRFDEAIALLDECPEEFRRFGDQLLAMARDGDRTVRSLRD